MMTVDEVVDIIGGVFGRLFFGYVAWVAFKKPPFDDFHNGGIHP